MLKNEDEYVFWLCIYANNLYVIHNKVFGVAPCQLYTNLKCESFVEKFLPLLKVNRDLIFSYPSHVALLVSYAVCVHI